MVRALYRLNACETLLKSQKGLPKEDIYTEDDSGCSTECLVTVTQTGLGQRASTFVVAEDAISGRKVRCEVIVDKVDRVEIETTSRQIFQDDVERLSVLAFDSEGNLFSTLEGLQFQWSLVPVNTNVPIQPLVFVPFSESTVEVSDRLLEMERQGVQSYATLVKGNENGRTYVSAKMVESGYTDVKQSTVTIAVLEPIELDPLQPVWLTPGSLLQYQLKTFKGEYSRVIPMPNDRYHWSSLASNVAVVDSRGLVRAVEPGTTQIIVKYQDMIENNAVGVVTVVMPAHLTLKIGRAHV